MNLLALRCAHCERDFFRRVKTKWEVPKFCSPECKYEARKPRKREQYRQAQQPGCPDSRLLAAYWGANGS